MKRFGDIDPRTATRRFLVPADWRRPDAGEAFEVLWDAKRSYGQVWPRPDPQQVAGFYKLDAYYTHHTHSAAEPGGTGLEQRILTKIAWHLDKGADPDRAWWSNTLGSRALRILEVGCGNGSNLSLLKAMGHETVGVEPDEMALETARRKGHRVFPGTAEALPAQVMQARFDVVIFIHVLEHCIDPCLAVRNAISVLKPGGYLVAEVPNNDCRGATRFGELWYWLDVPRHLNFFTQESLSELVSATGLDIRATCFRGYCRQFDANWRAAQSHIASMLTTPTDKRVHPVSYWRYLCETARAPEKQKYDSVRLVGQQAG